MSFLFGNRKQQSAEPPPRRRRQRRNQWLSKAAATLEPKLNDMVSTNALLQAAVLSKATGIAFESKDIKIQSPEEAFEAAVTTAALSEATKDKDYMEEAKEVMLDRMYAKGTGHRRLTRPGSRGGDGSDGEFPPGYNPGYDPNDPIHILDKADEIKERVGGGGGTLKAVLDSPVIMQLITTFAPMFLGGGKTAAPPPQIQGPSLIAVEVDGKIVQMTMEGFEVYKKMRQEQLLLNGAPPKPDAPMTIVPTGSIPPAGVPANAVAASTAAVPAAAADKKETPAPVEHPVPPKPDVELPKETIDQLVTAAKEFEDGMKKPGDVFAQEMFDSGDINPQVKFFASIIAKLADYDEMMAKLFPFRYYKELEPFIIKLEQNKEWAVKALAKLKELFKEEE